MSTLGDALAAIKSIILIEERIKGQAEKVEKLAQLVIDIDRRLVRVETMLDLAARRPVDPAIPLPTPRRRSSRDASEG
jgi:hypothetical protein